MNIIADTNIFLAVALDEPEKKRIIQLTAAVNIISPKVLPYEIGNALSSIIKRKTLTPNEAFLVLEAVEKIPVRLVSINIQQALRIAIRFNIYAYDAYFLQCALTYSCPLLTLDKRMKQVAIELGIEIVE